MVRSHSFNKLLEEKKLKVKEIIFRICAKRGLPLPSVNFEGCEGEYEDQLAHYHPETNVICISERQLIIQDFEDLEMTMAHEVSHILVQNHGPEFSDEEAKSSVAGWKPPPGVVHIIKSGKTTKVKEDGRKTKQDKTRCNYHLCRKKTKLIECKYCKNYFCNEHIEPCEPQVGNHLEDNNNSCHPCFQFAEYLEEIKKEKEEKYTEALNSLTGRRSRPSRYKDVMDKEDDSYLYRYIPPKEQHKDKRNIITSIKYFFENRFYDFKKWLRKRNKRN
jgi:hypothetical protein